MDELIARLSVLFPIPAEAGAAYEAARGALVSHVNRALAARPDVEQLIGAGNLRTMENNHANHAMLLSNVFRLNQPELLSQTIPWVYRAYPARGFSFDYFPVVMPAFIEAIQARLDAELAAPLVAVYAWILEAHPTMMAAAKAEGADTIPPENGWRATSAAFLGAILRGDHRACLALARERVKDTPTLTSFLRHVVQTSMYEVGRLWEADEISIAQEHLASSIVGRVMTALYMDMNPPEATRGKALVTAAPNEFHQLGALMLADLLELDGWETRFLGADMPQREVVAMVRDYQPQLLCLSVTMPFNLDRAVSLIQEVRDLIGLPTVRILVGGQVFRQMPELWSEVGADGFSANADEAVALARAWGGRP
jgi:methanogenic corrinoid protein MtbC1